MLRSGWVGHHLGIAAPDDLVLQEAGSYVIDAYTLAAKKTPWYGLVWFHGHGGSFTMAGRTHRFRTSVLALTFPGFEYQYEFHGKPGRHAWVVWSSARFGSMLDATGITPRDCVRRCDASRCERLFESLLRDVASPKPSRDLALISGLLSLMQKLFDGGSIDVDDNPGIERARRLIEADPLTSWSIEILARAAGLSRFHFMRAFKRAVGRSPGQYCIDQRLAIARNALSSGATVAAAAHAAAFDDVFYFSRLFKRKIGRSPSRYAESTFAPSR
jgi:AraC-like DNA-binding protein